MCVLVSRNLTPSISLPLVSFTPPSPFMISSQASCPRNKGTSCSSGQVYSLSDWVMPTIRPFTHILKVFDASPVIDFFTSGAIAHGALVYKLQPFLSLTSVLDSQPHIATRALLAGLVVHVVQLAERGATDLEPDPPEHGHQEKRDGAQAVVTGELRHLRRGRSLAREKEG